MALIDETKAKRFDASMPPPAMGLAAAVRTSVQGTAGDSVAFGAITVANGATSATATVGAGWNGASVFLTSSADPNSSTWWFGAVASGTLTVTVDQDPANAAGAAFVYMLVNQA